ncbi:hypothetical protein GSI_09484 [Ganoderma sinense ZZ0214-1]|uniref:F-box domain-containing protein n=1 Tax=Ganoderma sinense ZZ0214-1 TaxID=1077348 RepID=A0A2G8S3H3_9APHY|nr:hypothetical protein GSI_09484 [Ganoderma sinense ZZ0214-1]
MTSLGNILDELNTDVLLQVFDYLQPKGGLIPLSMTCWGVRNATIPIIFSRCRIKIKKPLNEDCFIPRSLWSYVR